MARVDRQKHLLMQVLGSVNFGRVTIDQILLLKRCDPFYERNFMAVVALKMMHAYD